MIIRKAKPSDFEQLFSLWKEYTQETNKWEIPALKVKLERKDFRKLVLKKLSEKTRQNLVLEEENKLIGMLFGQIQTLSSRGYKFNEDKIGYLENTFIKKQYRGKGAFSRAIKLFFEYLRQNKISHCALHVNIKNRPAIKTYERFGFKEIEYKMVAKI